MSSRLARDAFGRLVVVITTPSLGLDAGDRLRVLGDSLEAGAGPSEIYFACEKKSRARLAQEQQVQPVASRSM